MKLRSLLVVVLSAAPLALAQDEQINLEDLMREGAQWVQENINLNALGAMANNVDRDKAQQLFQTLQQRFQSEYVLDLAALKETAAAVLPLLEEHEETKPYAAWLKTRLDYFDLADTLKRATPPPIVKPGQPPKPLPNPGADLQRKAWQKQLENRPLPKDASSYVSLLKPVFAAQHLPSELVWVAEVESSFDPRARSPMGAAGLFQLMPRTAKTLGLSLWPRDERLQPEKNAAAAAKYLRYLHGQFQDWRLTLASYNAGEGTVRNLLTKYKTRSFDKIATHLPAETQMYVPKIEATLLRREGKTLDKLTSA